MSRVLAVIPARFGATRFPGKPLAMLWGKPMVQHVWEKCRAANSLDGVVVATDDDRILKACAGFGADAVMTDPALPSGTDRVAAAARDYADFEFVLNVQGDEPMMEPEVIGAVADLMRRHGVEIGTAVVPTRANTELERPHVVKAVVAHDGRALYFSRSVIPFTRNQPDGLIHNRHLGIYGFRSDVLKELVKLPPSPLEKVESLEQLRWLEAGYSIHTVAVQSDSSGIDTPEDLQNLSLRNY
ncbi:MAG: 3-deoxy-manno-octulosonate cytidylyltransferase [Calditrichaeota bacterium]|nr:3-deoxy-manno-octulosonate cytidylyltransferase [Calditrichota bacterium]MCB9367908.1 3-deoxy-manno-octulosonate cytidylyltransferase [Calditrichota bacterium]